MELRDVKQRFFALRNGLLAEMMRKQCASPHKLIFGLNLPQIKGIAAEAGTDAALGAQLWADTDCRESRLLAPMLLPADAGALRMLTETLTPEEADILCHSLLRRCPGAEQAAIEALPSQEALVRYGALRLLLNLLPASRAALAEAAGSVPFHPLTDAIVRQIQSELSYAGDI